jgi:hypothetical protein
VDKRPLFAIPVVCTPFFFMCFALLLVLQKHLHIDARGLIPICYWSGFVSAIAFFLLNPFSRQEMKERFGIEEAKYDAAKEANEYLSSPKYSILKCNIHHRDTYH